MTTPDPSLLHPVIAGGRRSDNLKDIDDEVIVSELGSGGNLKVESVRRNQQDYLQQSPKRAWPSSM